MELSWPSGTLTCEALKQQALRDEVSINGEAPETENTELLQVIEVIEWKMKQSL